MSETNKDKERQRKRLQNRAYYAANKDRINEQRRARHAGKLQRVGILNNASTSNNVTDVIFQPNQRSSDECVINSNEADLEPATSRLHIPEESCSQLNNDNDEEHRVGILKNASTSSNVIDAFSPLDRPSLDECVINNNEADLEPVVPCFADDAGTRGCNPTSKLRLPIQSCSRISNDNDVELRRDKRRKSYAANKERINKRRREKYAEKKMGLRITEHDSTCNRPPEDCDATIPEVSTPPHVVQIESSQVTRLEIGGSSRPKNRTSRTVRLQANARTMRLPSVPNCRYCGARKFYKETERFCCGAGEIVLAESVLPEYMVQLITSRDTRSIEFQNMIRTYNNHFAYSSIGIHCDEQYERRNNGIYTVRVQGQIHHFLDDLVPHDKSKKMSGLQFYFYDPQHQVTNRLTSLPRLDANIVKELVELLGSNPYSRFLQQASSLQEDLEKYHIVIRSNPGLDQRRYNKPTSSEVAGIWIENEGGEITIPEPTDVRVYTKSGRSHKVKYFYGCYDPLQYVLMFPNGEPGWHENIPKRGVPETIRRTIPEAESARVNVAQCTTFEEVLERETEGHMLTLYDDGGDPQDDEDGSTRRRTSRKRLTVSCREYYVYKLQIREGDRSYILRFGRLLQQYVIDNYVKLESMRLDFFRHNQKKLRLDHYQGIVDSVISGTQEGRNVGTRVYLPSTFIGGPRDMRHRYLDSMALVQEFGRPDIFLTMTCNPQWPEIKECLQPGEEAQNRPDLLARIFKAKLGILYDMIKNGEVFGEPASIVHVIEFQKRGLPHAHVLIILKPEFKYMHPHAYDRIVCAELPDKENDPYLYEIVVKHMVHGPCGDLNENNVCMVEGKCKNHYPKEFQEYTVHGKGSYPVYRRRNDGRTAKVRRKILDNRWVVPYNPTLLEYFDCHLNVEICCDIRAVKYLYKYVHKGHDKIKFRISPESTDIVDEISNFQDARWVSPVEAAWRLFGFPISGMYPPVVQLQVHLPNLQFVRFDDDADLEEMLQNDKFKRTMLTEFFNTNATDPEARRLNLLYKDFPKHYVWDNCMRTWRKRKRGNVVGRVCTVNPMDSERYYLRILLSNVKCPLSFDFLLTIEGEVCNSFRQAAYKRGFLHDDDDTEKTMEEASIYSMPAELRRLFATLLHYCQPADPSGLFVKFYDQMAEDFKKFQPQAHLSDDEILHKVLQGINDTLETLGGSVNEYRLVPTEFIDTEHERYTREIISERSIPVPDEDLHAITKLNTQQREAFDIIFDHAMTDKGGAFFVDGPGGTGKSFLYKVLLAHIRSNGYIGIIVASSGIASSNFLGGRTAHSRFKIPIDGGPTTKCQIKFQSGEAELLRTSKIIIWDEAPMANINVIQALDELLQDLCKDKNIFGGKLVVFGGDFRQVLPVVRGGSRQEQVNASLVSSTLWDDFIKIKLTDNMRSKDDPAFTEFLMRIGNGEEPLNEKGEMELPQPMIIPFTNMEESLESLISYVYPNLGLFESSPYEMMQRTILCSKNEFVDDINSKLINQFPGEEVIYTSDDRAKNLQDQGDYVDYLNTLEPRGLPPHVLVLKLNSPVILLRNINPVEGLCNGTRLICKHLTPHVVGAVISNGQFKGKHVWIPRIPLEPNPSDNKYLIPFIRRQIPLRLCFAMTINKAQGQTLECVGIYLKQPVFSHGQLYVAMSRAKTGDSVRVLIMPPTCNDPGTNYTANVVYNEVLDKASATSSG